MSTIRVTLSLCLPMCVDIDGMDLHSPFIGMIFELSTIYPTPTSKWNIQYIIQCSIGCGIQYGDWLWTIFQIVGGKHISTSNCTMSDSDSDTNCHICSTEKFPMYLTHAFSPLNEAVVELALVVVLIPHCSHHS